MKAVLGPSSKMSDDKKFLRSLSRGTRFCPKEHARIIDYLAKKNSHMHLDERNRYMEVDLYTLSPHQLEVTYGLNRSRESEIMCFFTQRNHKYYLKGSRTKNSGHGYWKLASQSEKPIKKANCRIGFIRSLIYYRGNKTKHETKTDWIMNEYRLNTQLNYADKLANSSATPPQSTNKLSEWVLCKVYNKNKINKVQDEQVITLEKPVVLEAVQDLQPEFPNSFIQDLVKELLTDSDPIALNEDQSAHYLIDNIPVLSGIYGNECIKLQANESSTSSTAYNVPDHLIPAEEITVVTSRKSKSSNNEHRDFASEYFKGQFS